MTLQPITIAEAKRFVMLYHRHHDAPTGALFALGVAVAGQVIGVALVGRPVARMLDDGWTAEVIRVAVIDGYPNACSKLYGAAKRAAQALGYRRVLTYTLASEPGSSLKGAGWTPKGLRGGGSWSRPSRPRVDTAPLEQKQLWEADVAAPRQYVLFNAARARLRAALPALEGG
jgi:hypothetical protein